MGSVFELRIHGRGGQGAKTAGQFIAEAAMYEGKEMQAFPEYGPERQGAPVVSYVKISDEKIKAFTPIQHAEAIVVIDETLLSPDIIEDSAEDCVMVVNTAKKADDIAKITGFKGKIITVDATKIALDVIGMNTPNTPMLGAFVKATGRVKLASINESVVCKFLEKIGEEKTKLNIKAVKKAYEAVK